MLQGEHSAILSTFTKLPFVIKIFVLSIFEWPLKTGFTALFTILSQGALFLWEQYQDQTHRLYHAHRSYAGVALVILRVVLAALFAWNLYATVSTERSIMKREFYISFTKVCQNSFLLIWIKNKFMWASQR